MMSSRKQPAISVTVHILLLLSLLIGLGMFWLSGMTARAESSLPTPTISSVKNLGYNSLELNVNLPSSTGIYKVNVYRSTSKNGKYTLVDTTSGQGGTWHSSPISRRALYYKDGDKNKAVFYRKSNYKGYYIELKNVPFNKNYYYKVTLTYLDESVSSNVVSFKTKLSAVSLVNCYSNSTSSVKLKWEKLSGADGYQIYRKESGGKWKKIKTISKGSTKTYTDKTVKSNKTYYYKVRGYRKSGSSKVIGSFSSKYKAKTSKPKVSGSYKKGTVYGPSLSTSKLDQVKCAVQGFKDNYIKSGMSNYEKATAAFEYLFSNCSYASSHKSNNTNTAWGALVKGKAECSGYARAYKALCDAINVPCYYVHASSKSSIPGHQWNMVKVNGKWYIADAQSGYYLLGSDFWEALGMRWSKSGLPTCSKKDHPKSRMYIKY